jgi:hypothetical protein
MFDGIVEHFREGIAHDRQYIGAKRSPELEADLYFIPNSIFIAASRSERTGQDNRLIRSAGQPIARSSGCSRFHYFVLRQQVSKMET